MTAEITPTVNDPGFWDRAYATGRDQWELAGPTPPLVSLLRRQPPPLGRVAVLGCGRGHDAHLLAQHGYEAWGFDFSAAAIKAARRLTGPGDGAMHFEQLDIFELPARYPASFDGIWEYTCFCAIDPSRRPEYVEVARSILKPSGWLLALFFPTQWESNGPPFPVRETEVHRLFEPSFQIERSWAPADSAKGRLGLEWFVMAHPR